MERLEKINELRQTLKELRELGATLKENFSLFEKSISQEKFPDDELLESINEDFSEWIDIADKCSDIYEELFDNDRPRTFPELEKVLNTEENRLITQKNLCS